MKDPLTSDPGGEASGVAAPPEKLISSPAVIDAQGDEFWPLSGKPYFSVILAKTHVNPSYQMVLPNRILQLLPSVVVPVVLSYKDNEWDMVYHGENRSYKRLDSKWRTFVIDNNLKTGDACVFELTECSIQIIKFRVQILRGDIPCDLMDKINGESSDAPIVIE